MRPRVASLWPMAHMRAPVSLELEQDNMQQRTLTPKFDQMPLAILRIVDLYAICGLVPPQQGTDPYWRQGNSASKQV